MANKEKNKIFTFRGGFHIDQGEELTCHKPIRVPPLIELYYVPLQQHIGAPAVIKVKKGDTVARGGLLAEPGGFVSAAIHSPTSGTVADIAEVPGPAGTPVKCVMVESDGEDRLESSLEPIADWRAVGKEELLKRVAEAGIVGMGGAAFPTHVKLSPPPDKKIDTLVVNAAECEPYLTADDLLMRERTAAVVEGIAITAHILGVAKVVYGVEDNKPEAIEALRVEAAKYGQKVVSLPVHYPQGAEKQLIYALTGRKVPPGALPMEVGCVVQNVGSAAAIRDAVVEGLPLFERVTTVTGSTVVDPGNWRLRVGTPISQAIVWAGGVKEQPAKVILGGPMMGFAQKSLEVPVQKNTSGILLLAADEISQYTSSPCIRCGRCVEACPMNLMPASLSVMIESEKYDLAEADFALNCMECGCCAYVCPARRPLVQHLKRAKAEIMAKRKRKA